MRAARVVGAPFPSRSAAALAVAKAMQPRKGPSPPSRPKSTKGHQPAMAARHPPKTAQRSNGACHGEMAQSENKPSPPRPQQRMSRVVESKRKRPQAPVPSPRTATSGSRKRHVPKPDQNCQPPGTNKRTSRYAACAQTRRAQLSGLTPRAFLAAGFAEALDPAGIGIDNVELDMPDG